MRPVGAAGGNWDVFLSLFVGDWNLRFSPKIRHQDEVGEGGDV